jgi:hypothetical protein
MTTLEIRQKEIDRMTKKVTTLEIIKIETCEILETFEDHGLAHEEFALLSQNHPGVYCLCREGGMPVETYSDYVGHLSN